MLQKNKKIQIFIHCYLIISTIIGIIIVTILPLGFKLFILSLIIILQIKLIMQHKTLKILYKELFLKRKHSKIYNIEKEQVPKTILSERQPANKNLTQYQSTDNLKSNRALPYQNKQKISVKNYNILDINFSFKKKDKMIEEVNKQFIYEETVSIDGQEYFEKKKNPYHQRYEDYRLTRQHFRLKKENVLNIIETIKKQFYWLISENIVQQKANFQKIKQVLESKFQIKIKLKNIQETKSLEQAPYIQQRVQQVQLFDAVQQLVDWFYQGDINLVLVFWNHRDHNLTEKKRTVKQLQKLIIERIQLDAFLTVKRSFNGVEGQERFKNMIFLQNMTENKQRQILYQEEITQNIGLLLLNFLIIDLTKLGERNNELQKMLKDGTIPMYSLTENLNESYIMFVNAPSERNDEFNIEWKKERDGINKGGLIKCQPGKNNFFSCILFYLLLLKQSFIEEYSSTETLQQFGQYLLNGVL